MDEQLDRVEVDPLLDIEPVRCLRIADRERKPALPCGSSADDELESLDTPANRHKQARATAAIRLRPARAIVAHRL
jgi:hypothetical protein